MLVDMNVRAWRPWGRIATARRASANGSHQNGKPAGAHEIRAEAEHLLATEHFKRSEKQAALLRYLLEKQIGGQGEELTEFRLAVEVFQRQAEKWLPEDSIVRVQMHELRRHLREHYAGEGKSRPFRVEIPRGSYRIECVPASVPQSPIAAPEPGAARPGSWMRAHPLLGSLAAASLLVNGWFLISSLRGSGMRDRADSYSELFGSNERETLLCLGNPSVLSVEAPKNLPTPFSAKEYLPLPASLAQLLGTTSDATHPAYLHPTTDEYTGMGEAVCAFRMGRLLERRGFKTQLTQARFLSWDRALHDNLVVLGHPRHASVWTRTNIFTRLFPPGDTEIRFRDREYARVFDPQTSRIAVDYGVISKETTSSGCSILVLAGNTSFGTYGLGEFFADAAKMNEVFRKLRLGSGNHDLPRNFAVLFQIKVADNIPTDISIVDTLTDDAFFQ